MRLRRLPVLKELYAFVAGQGERAALTGEARARFLSEHAALVGRRFASKLPEGAPAYLRATARALAERLPEVAPAPLEVPAADEESFACGGLPAR